MREHRFSIPHAYHTLVTRGGPVERRAEFVLFCHFPSLPIFPILALLSVASARISCPERPDETLGLPQPEPNLLAVVQDAVVNVGSALRLLT